MPTISGKYKFNSTLPQLAEGEYPVTFTSNGGTFAKFAVEGSNFYYLTASNNGVNAYLFGINFWNSGEAYRDIDFGSTPQTISDTLYNYLVANAAKEETQTTFDLSALNLAAGTYSITVKAEAEGYTTSDASNSVNYTVTIPIPTDSILFAGETSDFTLKAINKEWNGTVEYSTDKNTWYTWDGSEIPSADKKLYLRGKNNTTFYTKNGAQLVLSANAGCYGNINTLLDYENPPTTLAKHCYRSMFQGCKLTSAPELPATTLADYCYYQMFYGCTKLVSAPELPATTLAYSCYESMFGGCTSLTTAPALPATTLASYCYYHLFEGCTSLTTAPELPATTLAVGCYENMFKDCTSLTTAPELPATTLKVSCYHSMFYGCTSLTTAPELSVTTLASSCYQGMFGGCTSLTTAPELPATTLFVRCYQNMFQGCTSLTTGPELPATTLAMNCYDSMFNGCKSLTTAPALPATKLKQFCYWSMFQDCTSLTTAPALPATTLEKYCYVSMFQGCTSLKVSETQTEEYTIAWRIPSTGEITSTGTQWNVNMLTNTGGTFTANPSINTTYYIAG